MSADLLGRLAQAAAELATITSNCVPESTLIVSVVNIHHRELRHLQWQRVKGQRCLLARALTVCSGFEDETYGRCIGTQTPYLPSDFRKRDYFELIWLKWKMLGAVLGACAAALWVDADVLLLRNPFEGLRLSSDVALAYQSETPHCSARCTPGCPMNGGVLFASNRTLVQDILQTWRGEADARQTLDQRHAEAVLRRRIWRHRSCALSSSFYVGQCQLWKGWYRSMTNRSAPTSRDTQATLCHAFTFHTCGVGTANAKRELMQATLNGMARCSAATLNTWAQQRHAPAPPRRRGSILNIQY